MKVKHTLYHQVEGRNFMGDLELMNRLLLPMGELDRIIHNEPPTNPLLFFFRFAAIHPSKL